MADKEPKSIDQATIEMIEKAVNLLVERRIVFESPVHKEEDTFEEMCLAMKGIGGYEPTKHLRDKAMTVLRAIGDKHALSAIEKLEAGT